MLNHLLYVHTYKHDLISLKWLGLVNIHICYYNVSNLIFLALQLAARP